MRPYSSVQCVMSVQPSGKRVAGSCFRLWSKRHFITASHVVDGLDQGAIQILNPLGGDFPCCGVVRHPSADVAIVEVADDPPSELQCFSLFDKDFLYGLQIHSFGLVSDLLSSQEKNPFRVVGGILQRDFTYSDGRYTSPAVEIACPIPKGHSGAPAFIAANASVAIGVSIATIRSEIALTLVNEYEDESEREIERISEFTRYGVVALLNPLRPWLVGVMGEPTKQELDP